MAELWQDYRTPTTIAEALQDLARYAGRARLIAGGTDLIIEMQDGRRAAVEALVDVTRIPELRTLTRNRDWITVGAAVTHAEIVDSTLLQEAATCLVESCGVVGGPQVRNVATLGGNVAHALPAADGTISLLALEAEAQVARRTGERVVVDDWQPLESLFAGPGQSTIDPTRDLLVAFRFRPSGPGEGSAFSRIMRPQGIALPILGMAVRVRLDSQATIATACIAVGPAGPVPFRARATESLLAHRPLDEDTLQQAVQTLQGEARLRTSRYRATAEYRLEMLDVLLRRTLPQAVARAGRAATT